jgi:hypothetical protein
MKSTLKHGLIAGLLTALASVTYLKLYESILYVDFSQILNIRSVSGASIIGCLLITGGYLLVEKMNKEKWKGGLNILVILLSFLSILGPISMNLPLDIEFPELFPGLAIPMHFFPAMIFFGLQPFFLKEELKK